MRNDPSSGRYYTYIIQEGAGGKSAKALAAWGMETFHYRDDILCITEGIFDACRLHNFGLPAIAVLLNDPKRFRPWLNVIGTTRRIYVFCDNDDAGFKMQKFGTPIELPGKDLGDMSDQTIEELLIANKIIS